MLFLLTGDVQIGKTRWLEDLCASLQAAGTCVAGVVAPGQWAPRPEGQPGGKHGFDGAGRFEKLGIDNVLLPQSKRIEFGTPPRPCGRGQGVRRRGAGKGGEAGMGYLRHRDRTSQRPLRRAGETGRHRACRQRRKRPRDCASRGRHPCSRTARQRRLPARSRGNRRRSAPARTN